MWSDKHLVECSRCGMHMMAERGSRVCDACMIGHCADPECRLHTPRPAWVQRALSNTLVAKDYTGAVEADRP